MVCQKTIYELFDDAPSFHAQTMGISQQTMLDYQRLQLEISLSECGSCPRSETGLTLQ